MYYAFSSELTWRYNELTMIKVLYFESASLLEHPECPGEEHGPYPSIWKLLQVRLMKLPGESTCREGHAPLAGALRCRIT